MELYPFFLPVLPRGHSPTARRGEVRQRLLTTLGRHMGRKITDSDLTVNKHGKPSLRSNEVHFNLSHSGDWLYILLSHTAVGVDIEHGQPRRATQTLRDFLSLKCDSTLCATDEQAIARIWSRLEAVTKCIGLGMTVPLDQIRVPAAPSPQPVAVSTPFGSLWLVDLPAATGYCATAVGACKPERIQVSAPVDFFSRLNSQPDSGEQSHCANVAEMPVSSFFTSSSVHLGHVRY